MLDFGKPVDHLVPGTLYVALVLTYVQRCNKLLQLCDTLLAFLCKMKKKNTQKKKRYTFFFSDGLFIHASIVHVTLLQTWDERSVFPYNMFPLRCPSTVRGHDFKLINVTIHRLPKVLSDQKIWWWLAFTCSPASNSAAVYLIVFFIWCNKKKTD